MNTHFTHIMMYWQSYIDSCVKNHVEHIYIKKQRKLAPLHPPCSIYIWYTANNTVNPLLCLKVTTKLANSACGAAQANTITLSSALVTYLFIGKQIHPKDSFEVVINPLPLKGHTWNYYSNNEKVTISLLFPG